MDLHELVFNYERAACHSGHLFLICRVGQKSKPHIFANIFAKYWPIFFTMFSLANSVE